MKISKLFHWLYASLMLLPFASVVSTTLYYSFNKNAVIPQVDKEVSREVDFNQHIVNGNFVNSNNIIIDNNVELTLSDNEGIITLNNNVDLTLNSNVGVNLVLDDYTLVNHKYLFVYTAYADSTGDLSVLISKSGSAVTWDNSSNEIQLSTTKTTYYKLGTCNISANFVCFGIFPPAQNYTFYLSNCELFDLTQMFGVGNEPSIQDFTTLFTDDYYVSTLSEHIVLPNYETIQVADNSINHFWLPSFGAIGYNIQSYIGWLIGSVFGLNVVNGIGFVIVRLFTYWLIISICWLIFDVLMYVPNLVHKWLDKAAID